MNSDMSEAFISQKKQCSRVLLYCAITLTCTLVSLYKYNTLTDWILYNDWAMFLIWHSEFHFCYVLYYTLSRKFLGVLRPFERREARKKHLIYLMNTISLTLLISGPDLFEAFCWLQWSTPFGFFHMSTTVMKERLNNPFPLKLIIRKPNIFSRSNQTLSSLDQNTCILSGKTSRVNVESISQKSSLVFQNRYDLNACNEDCKRNFLHHFFSSLDSHSLWMTFYSILLLVFLFIWTLFGGLVYGVLPLRIKFLVFHERLAPMDSLLLLLFISNSNCHERRKSFKSLSFQWSDDISVFYVFHQALYFCPSVICAINLTVIILTCVISEMPDSNQSSLSKYDILFCIRWNENLIEQLLYATRYCAAWFLVGHSLISSFMDILILMKLKEIFYTVLQTFRHLEKFLLARKLVDHLPTVIACSNLNSNGYNLVDSSNNSFLFFGASIFFNFLLLHLTRILFFLYFSCKQAFFFVKDYIFVLFGFKRFFPLSYVTVPPQDTNMYSRRYSTNSYTARSKYNFYDKDLIDFTICVVCHEIVHLGKQLPCGHLFHRNCLRQWVESEFTCPVCRSTCVS